MSFFLSFPPTVQEWWNSPIPHHSPPTAGAECPAARRLQAESCGQRYSMTRRGMVDLLIEIIISARQSRPKRKAAAEEVSRSATAPSSRELLTPFLHRLAESRNEDESCFYHRVALNLVRTMCVFSPRSPRTHRAIYMKGIA